ncbi:unnamed protein product [Prunus armeniaca]
MEYSSRQRYWVLEKLVSCKDLKAFNLFQKFSVYAIVSLKVISDDAEKKVKEAEEQMNEEVVEQQIKKVLPSIIRMGSGGSDGLGWGFKSAHWKFELNRI